MHILPICILSSIKIYGDSVNNYFVLSSTLSFTNSWHNMYLLLRSSLVSLDSIEVVRIMLNRQLQYLFKILLFVWGVIKSKYESSIHFKYNLNGVYLMVIKTRFLDSLPPLYFTKDNCQTYQVHFVTEVKEWTIPLLT